MSALPLVSIVMSVYNGEKYLEEAIKSILSQSFGDFEFIIINDGSADGTGAILVRYQRLDDRIRVFNQENQGLIASLNRGCRLAKGKYIARMDADDISLPSRFAKQVDFLEQHPEVGILGTQMEVINEADRTIDIYEVPCSHSMIAWTLLFGRSFAHPSVMIRRSVIRKAGGYDPSFLHTEDYELWTRLVEFTRFANLSDSLFRYRTHTGAISRQHADTQQANVLLARQRLMSRIFGKEIPRELLEWVYKSQLPEHVLTDGQIKRVITLILNLYSAMSEKGFLRTDELDEVHTDMLRRIIAASRCGSFPRADLARAYWRSVLGGQLWRVVRAMAHPRRAASIVLRQTKQVMVEPKRRKADQAPTTANERIPAMAPGSSGVGITLVVLSYERLQALAALLKSLLKQELAGMELELIICNNSPRVRLTKSQFSSLGRLLNRYNDIKIINSSHNWRCGVRYAIATLARYETILFLDDDIILIDPHFIRYMFDHFQKLTPMDILSCWCTLWVEWNDDYFSAVSMSFTTPEIIELTETDTCGMGICMFNKQVLSQKLLRRIISPPFPEADDMGFSLIAALECGSRSYYLPSYGMLGFHKDCTKGALYNRAGHYDDLYAFYKSLLNEGYKPVLSRLPSRFAECDLPSHWAVRAVPVVKHPW